MRAIRQKNSIKGTGQIDIIDTLLILSQIPEKEYSLQIYSLKDYQYISSAIPRGKGSNEVRMPGWGYCQNTQKILWQPDVHKGILLGYHIDSILNNKRYYPAPDYQIIDKELTQLPFIAVERGFWFYNNFHDCIDFKDMKGRAIDSLRDYTRSLVR